MSLPAGARTLLWAHDSTIVVCWEEKSAYPLSFARCCCLLSGPFGDRRKVARANLQNKAQLLRAKSKSASRNRSAASVSFMGFRRHTGKDV